MHDNAAGARCELAQVSTSLLQTLAEMVEGHGIGPTRLCRGLGFIIGDLQNLTQRISCRQAVSMIQRVLRVLPERGLGLWVGHRNVLGTLGLLSHALSPRQTLCDALDTGVHYQYSSGGIVTPSVYRQGETFFIKVRYHPPSSEMQVFAIGGFSASLLVHGRALVGPASKPLGIELIHVAPPYTGEYLRLLGPQIRSDCLHDRMVIVSHQLDMCLPNHNLSALHQALALLEQGNVQVHRKLNLAQAVGRVVTRDLGLGSQIERVSAEPNASSHILRCRLVERGLTFKALLRQVRQGWAMNLLGNPGMSIEHITEEAGYRDIRGFKHAFKCWTGVNSVTPRDEGMNPLGQAFMLTAWRQERTAIAHRSAPRSDDQ